MKRTCTTSKATPLGLLIIFTILSVLLVSGLTAHAQTADPTTIPSATTSAIPAVDMPTSDAVPDGLPEAIGLIPAIITAFRGGQYALGAGLIVMILVFVFNTYLVKGIPGKYLPWVSIVVGVAISVGTALIGGQDVVGAIGGGAMTGLAGAGLWSAGGKALLKILPTPKDAASNISQDVLERAYKKMEAVSTSSPTEKAVEDALARLREG